MVTTHSHAMDLMGMAKKHMLSEHFELFARHAKRMLRIYGQQVSIMGKYRNGGKQTVEVKHIHVETRGQDVSDERLADITEIIVSRTNGILSSSDIFIID